MLHVSDSRKDEFISIDSPVLQEVRDRSLQAFKAKHYLESFFLLWGLIEQVSLPAVMRAYANMRDLQYFEPRTMHEAQNLFYYLVNDEELYRQLDKARRKRNNFFHNLHTRFNSFTEIESQIAEDCELLVEIDHALFGKWDVAMQEVIAKKEERLETSRVQLRKAEKSSEKEIPKSEKDLS